MDDYYIFDKSSHTVACVFYFSFVVLLWAVGSGVKGCGSVSCDDFVFEELFFVSCGAMA